MHTKTVFTLSCSQSTPYLLVVFLLLVIPIAEAKEVNIPVQINYPYLQQALIEQLYTDSDQSKEIWSDGGGCSRIVLSDPRIDSMSGLLRITNQAIINISLPLGAECVPVYKRTGIIETYHQPLIEKDRFALRFDVVDMKVFNLDKTPLAEGQALDLLSQLVDPQLSAMRIDLEPMIADIKQFLPKVMPTVNTVTLQKILGSLSFRTIAAEQAYLYIVLGLMVDNTSHGKRFEPPLTQSELDRWEQDSQQWDAFLTYTIKQIASHSKSETVRETLLNLLIETRYDILTLLSAGPVDQASDPVRDLFVNVWSRLTPVLREVTHELKGDLPLHYLTFIVAGDILQALDNLDPGFDLDISLGGLRRMARILAPDDEHDPLEYNQDIDTLLRQLFGTFFLQSSEYIVSPARISWFIKSAHALINNAALRHKLNNWAPSRTDINEYLPLVHHLLIQIATDTQKSKKLNPSYQKLFHDMLLATAWQESCWRQFVKSGNGIKTLMSPLGDIGIMQVNRKVWRGFYDAKKLEKDIAYNATAGSEILLYYLMDHALKKGIGKSGGDSLARASYGAYNGGPRHLARYRKSSTPAELRKIDESFWSKYKRVKNGDMRSIASCYGETTGTVKFSNQLKEKHKAAKIPAPVSKPPDRPAKLLQSNPQNFTIQLMSSRNKTEIIKFMQHNKLNAKAEYLIYRHNNETWYRLIYGSYVTRKAAEDEAQSLKNRLNLSDLWVRQISSIK